MLKKIKNFYKTIFWSKEKYARSIGVEIGANCSIGTKYFGSEPYLIRIGDNVQITSDVRFFTHGGAWVFRNEYPEIDTFGKIEIKNNVYIGSCSLILPGVTIGSNVIIGAGTTVTKSIPDNSVVVGNPGRIICKIDDIKKKILNYNVNSKSLSEVEKRSFLLSLPESNFIKK